ncbi:protein phosphatase 2c (macronuclear) [Tetrahymena thermophila SB210]|uniref:protein-serine/threonine phosphatase n=1 Tax=Tetrahymena thermophila (strain SB210) TaxID=312017 RepID=I7M9M5_TETTS|nr:protein phosphatase 2c [Tetrahymena thermophila SB210]EAS02121.2 protein phosphatase 2c [Tetrahymena thermophila SB210]|eukprot:XP_001022366.2 protein phosphatase 2c [Tetrahymena thermophila SB210]
MRNNRSDGSIMSNTLNRNANSNLGLLRPSSRIQLNTVTQTENLPYSNGHPIRSIRGRIENNNLNQHHSSTVNTQGTNRRLINSALREIQSEQNSFQQPSSVNEMQQENFLQQVNDKLHRNTIQQRSQSLQKIKNMRESQGESPLKKITSWNNNQQQNGTNNKSYSAIINQNNNYALQRGSYKDATDILKLNNSQVYQHIPKLQDVRESNNNFKLGSLPLAAAQNNQNVHIGINSNMINCNQIEFKYNIDQSKRSNRSYGIIKAYAANTNMGIFRNYNEDRVSIILSISKPFNKNADYWPKTSFFAIYDGHGGSNCSDFLRDNLHLFIVRDEFFPSNPTEAIKRGIQFAEQSFLQTAESNMDRSGSCAIIVMILDDVAYTVNIGDSRAIVSLRNGQSIESLSIDHKPEDERQRIEAAGGKVYQATVNTQNLMFQGVKINPPHRVFPGKLSVSRTIGDYEAKSQKYGGNPKVIISDPDIVVTKITQDHDFILLGCDGVFDRLSTQEVGKIFWTSAQQSDLTDQSGDVDIHKQCGIGIEAVMRETFERKSLDNITLVAISFDGFASEFSKIQEKKQKEQANQPSNNLPQAQLLTMPPVNQNQISNTYSSQNTSSRVKQKQIQRNLNNNLQNSNSQQQMHLFPKVSPTNMVQTNPNYNTDPLNTNTINNDQQQQLVSPQKHRFNTLQSEANLTPYTNGYLSTQNYQYPQSHQNNYNNLQIYNHKMTQNYGNSSSQTNIASINQNQQYQNDQNGFYSDIAPLQESKNSQNNLQSNSLNTRLTQNKQDFENSYFHKKNRLSTPSTIRKYSNLQTSISNTSNTQLQIENSRLALQSNQSLQTLKALQNEKIFQQLQQIQQQQKMIQAKKK